MKNLNKNEMEIIILKKYLKNDVLKNYINGKWTKSDNIVNTINPSDTSDIVSKAYQASKKDTKNAILSAYDAKEQWASSSIALRQTILDEIAKKLLQNKDFYGEIIAREAGKPIKEATDEVVKSAEFFSYFAAESIRNKGVSIDSPRQNVDIEVINEAVGVVGLITPWNYPLAIPAWKLAPALAYGNTVILKPANNTPTITFILAQIIDSTDLPKGVFNLVNGDGKIVGNEITGSNKVDAISFTGSVEVGKIIAKNSIDNMIKLQLEMGSKNSLIILDDANIDLAVAAAIKGSYNAAGQKCTSSSRLIVTPGIYDEFLQKMQVEMKKLTVGNALDTNSQIGPAISQTQLNQNLSYVKLAKQEGATHVYGGEVLNKDTKGFFFTPALFTNGDSKMKFNQEEIFGPIACIIRVKDYKEALETLNDTQFGLSGGIITNDLKTAMHFKHNAKIGNVMINLPTAGMDNHVPFGGSKNSSYGSREKSFSALAFYTSSKTSYIQY